MSRWLILAAIAVSVPLLLANPFQKTASQTAPRAACGYDNCAPIVADKLNVHLVAHTHDDVGWLKTLDQYYYGSRTNIQRAGVQYILDSVVQELLVDSSRRFIWVETSFLTKWWLEQTEETKETFRGLVNSGQLEIISGGWSMNDEAAVHYQATIDQFTWGFRVLNDTLGECSRPTIGWQIDPFGHSREHASISARLGFDVVFLGRLDYQDKRKRFNDKTAELIWRGSPDNLGDTSDIFTHVLYNNYAAPPGFCFDVNCDDDPMIDDPRSPAYNIPAKVRAFSNYVTEQSNNFRSNNVILTMGEDFHYQDANVWYKNLDKVIKYVNADADSNMNVFYSTPSCYLKAVNDEGLSFPEKTDDFFPYASDFQTYWVGYFTSKPTTKYFERLGNNILQVSKQLATLAGIEDQTGITELREAIGVMQHHDAITGTMKDHVAQDYLRIVNSAIIASANTAGEAINKLMGNTNGAIPVWNCLKLNISECAATEGDDNFVITVYNPLSRPVAQYIRVPVTGAEYEVLDPAGAVVAADIVPIHPNVLTLPGRVSQATTELVFRADSLPPLGYQQFYVSKAAAKKVASQPPAPQPRASRADTIGNERITVNIDDNGLTQSININGIDVNLAQTFEYYLGAYKSGERSSGAYIFRPNGTDTVSVDITSFTVSKTPLVEEVHQVFGDGWISQVIRVYKEENHVEFEWMVGPIPEDNQEGKEVISKYATDLASEATFYTDSNARELLKRVRDYRPTWIIDITETIASNYYPIVSKLLLRDETKGVEVAVLVDRAQGGSSIHDGEIELMLHRRLYHDDNFGVGEALNEEAYGTGVVARGKHWLVAGPLGTQSTSLAAQERRLATRKFLNGWTFISPSNGLSQPEWDTAYNLEYSGLTGSGLPTNVQILTLEPWTQNTLLLRLEHILEINEDDVFSEPAVIDLSTAFSQLTINSAVEMTLGGNQPIDELNRLQWNSEVKRARTPREHRAVDITAITLNPMEIRTFIVDYTLA